VAYTSPATYTLNQALAHTDLNLVSANLNSLRAINDYSIRVHRTAVQSLTNNTRLAITWQAAQFQTGITWSSGTNPTRLTVTLAGLYLLVMNVKFANTAGGRRGCGWRKNGGATNWDLQNHPANGVDTVSGIELIDLAAGDYIETWAYQNSGGAINTAGTTEGDCWAALSLVATGTTTATLWTPPRTWADGDVLSPAMLNTHLRDNLVSLRNLKGVGAKVWLSDDQSITSDDRQVITWDRSTRNLGGLWDGGSKFVAPVDGAYLCLIDLEWADSGTAPVMGVGYRLNDLKNHDLQLQEGDSNGENQSGGDLVLLQAGEFIEWFAYQTSGEAIDAHGATEDRTRASVTLWAAAT